MCKMRRQRTRKLILNKAPFENSITSFLSFLHFFRIVKHIALTAPESSPFTGKRNMSGTKEKTILLANSIIPLTNYFFLLETPLNPAEHGYWQFSALQNALKLIIVGRNCASFFIAFRILCTVIIYLFTFSLLLP